MRYLCFTVDLDRDVNLLVPGHIEAGSIDRGEGNSPRFTSSAKGLALFSQLFDELSMSATFFAEARTLEFVKDQAGDLNGHEVGVHGYQHEDYTYLSNEEAHKYLKQTIETVSDISGSMPKSFRAPYMKKPDYLDKELLDLGLSIDSSTYSTECQILCTPSGLCEVPVVTNGQAGGSKQTGYFWPLHEGYGACQDYLDLVHQVPDGGCLVLADHTWHLVESRRGGIVSMERRKRNVEDIRCVLTSILDSGFVPVTLADACARSPNCARISL